jgi:hypothetical protein
MEKPRIRVLAADLSFFGENYPSKKTGLEIAIKSNYFKAKSRLF